MPSEGSQHDPKIRNTTHHFSRQEDAPGPRHALPSSPTQEERTKKNYRMALICVSVSFSVNRTVDTALAK